MIAIILVNWNGWQDTVACIQSCLALETSDSRIIVCDNASSDSSVENIHAWATGKLKVNVPSDSPVAIASPRLPAGTAIMDKATAEAGDDAGGAELILVQTGANLGFAGGNNVGLRWALAQNASHVWLLNNDTVVPANALCALTAFMDKNPALGLCGSMMVEYARPDRLQGYAGALDGRTFRGRHLGAGLASKTPAKAMRDDPLREGEILYPIGASMLASRRFLMDVGLMDEEYFLYYEEADWVLRAETQFEIGIAAASVVYHKVGASAGKLSQGMTAFASGFLYRSRLRAARKFAANRMGYVWLALVDDLARSIYRRRWGQVRGIVKAVSGKVIPPMIK